MSLIKKLRALEEHFGKAKPSMVDAGTSDIHLGRRKE